MFIILLFNYANQIPNPCKHSATLKYCFVILCLETGKIYSCNVEFPYSKITFYVNALNTEIKRAQYIFTCG